MRIIASVAIGCLLVASAPPVTAGTYTITLNANDTDGNTDATWTRSAGIDTVDEYNGLLKIGKNGNVVTYRSLLEFNLDVLPNSESVTNANLTLQLNSMDGYGPSLSLGWIKHLDAASATGHPASDFNFDSLNLGTALTTLIPNQLPLGKNSSFDVTAAIMADHAANHSFSAFSMVEDPNRLVWGFAAFCSETNGLCGWHPALVVTTAAVPEADTWAMLLAGLGLIALFARVRRSGAV